VTACRMCVVSGFLVLPALVMLRGFAVVAGSFLVMLRRLHVMVAAFFDMECFPRCYCTAVCLETRQLPGIRRMWCKATRFL
jgi:hypothetical protein